MGDLYRYRQHYRPCARFMERSGSLIMRCPVYPWRLLRVQRIFHRIIVIHSREPDLLRHTENAKAFNRHTMVPIFAYQCRPRYWQRSPPPVRKLLPLSVSDEWQWQQAA